MSLLLPLSPHLTLPLCSAVDLQRALFQASTFSDIAAVHGALEGVANAIQPHRSALEHSVSSKGVTFRREMRYFDHLLSRDSEGSRLALSEIAMHPKALELLLHQSPQTARNLAETAAGIAVDATGIREAHLNWLQVPLNGPGDSPLTAWGQITYWLSSLAAPANWLSWTSAASMAVESAYWAGSGQTPTTAFAASSALLAGALYGMAHRKSAKNRLVEAARRAPLDFESARGFLESFNRLIPANTPSLDGSGNPDVIESIRKSSALGGVPNLSLPTTLQVIADFLNFGSATVQGLGAPGSSKDLYNRLAQAIGFGTLSRTRWQPTVLNAHRMEQIAEYRRQGKKVIFVGNHRSHLDILLAVALLRDFDIRFVAKSELLKVPVLGDILRMADHFTVDREHDDRRLEKVSAWGVRTFEKGLCPFFFIEGTRMDTPLRREEVGIRPPEIGAAHLAAQFPNDVVIVPVVSYGFGRLLRKEESLDAVLEGTMRHQPTVTSILEPIEVWNLLDADPALSKDEEIRLNSLLWNRMWAELSRIQAYMNDLSAKAA
ncbi:MAG TPA: lysophospholipid acyltransferase family protein [bacterium]|nr:lysophospholipid acyltransferase family protein [bacterium]